jgi:hypothetical protein
MLYKGDGNVLLSNTDNSQTRHGIWKDDNYFTAHINGNLYM